MAERLSGIGRRRSVGETLAAQQVAQVVVRRRIGGIQLYGALKKFDCGGDFPGLAEDIAHQLKHTGVIGNMIEKTPVVCGGLLELAVPMVLDCAVDIPAAIAARSPFPDGIKKRIAFNND